MLTFITIISKGSGPYWNTIRKQLATEKIAPLTITHAPNLIGHPIGILLLISLGMFVLPTDPMFFLFWFGTIAISAIVNIFIILGLLKTKFFTTQIIGSLGFVSSAIFASLFLGEQLTTIKIFCLFLAILGVVFFSWPKKAGKLFAFDQGVIFTLLAVFLGGLASVLHKSATFHVSNPSAFFTGRFVGDLIGWTLVWLVSMWIIKRNPVTDLTNLVHKQHGKIFIIGVVASTFIDSWLIYKLPISTIAIIGTIAFPVSYFLSSFKYKEHITFLMWLGTISIISSIVLFLIAK
jgi:drug/metabolite transporter (DMT)-like permease